MASILEFRKPFFNFRPGRSGSESISADIVLFPGVRYERAGEEPAAPSEAKPRGRRSRRRDRLDLD
jgi:hypothetical protein